MVARLITSRLFTLTVAISALTHTLTPVVVHAEAPKFTHDSRVTLDVKLTERTQPPARRDEPPRPGIGSDDALRVEGLLGDIHAEQIEVLRTLIANTPDSEPMEKAEVITAGPWATLASSIAPRDSWAYPRPAWT